MTVAPSNTTTINVPAGQVLSLACPVGSVGSVTRLADQPGQEPYAPVAIAGSNLMFGPFQTTTRFAISVTKGVVTETVAPPAFGAMSLLNSQNIIPAVVAGGVAGNITVAGILTTDKLVAVFYLVGAGTTVTDVQNLTSQFSITAANTINNTGGTASTGGKLVILYQRQS